MKKKILIAIDSLGVGGAEKVLITLLQHLNKEKYDVTLLLLFNEGVYVKDVPSHIKMKSLFNIKSSLLRRAIYKFVKYSSAHSLYSWFIKDQYDVEIAFLEGSTTKILSGSTNPESKKIAWVHTDISYYHWTRHYFRNKEEEKARYQVFNEIAFVSNDALSGFTKTLNITDNLKVIYNPIDANEIIRKAEEETIEYTKPTIISVGRLIEQKGFDRLINIHSKLIKEGIDHDLLIIGAGQEMDSLRQQCKDLNVETSVKFLGFQANPYKFVKAADLYVSSSRAEGLSLVVAEALILGTPVVSTRCSGPVELLDNGKYGVVVDNSEDGLYKGVKQLLTDSQEQNKYANLTKLRISFFDINHIMKQIETLIDQ